MGSNGRRQEFDVTRDAGLVNERRAFLQTLIATALASGVAGEAAASAQAAGGSQGARTPQQLRRQPLPSPFDGLDAAFSDIHVQPGVEGRPHKHSGFVLGYVLEGEYSFAVNGEAPRVVRAGETFFEPPGATHTTSASANGQPVRFLAIVIGPQGAAVTASDR
jgi:quercetin dioxygenase-like cupin family protein